MRSSISLYKIEIWAQLLFVSLMPCLKGRLLWMNIFRIFTFANHSFELKYEIRILHCLLMFSHSFGLMTSKLLGGKMHFLVDDSISWEMQKEHNKWLKNLAWEKFMHVVFKYLCLHTEVHIFLYGTTYLGKCVCVCIM